MRTTLKIDDDVLQAARNLAAVQEETIGEIISLLARRGLAPRVPGKIDRQFPVFEVSDDAAPLTSALIQRAPDDKESRRFSTSTSFWLSRGRTTYTTMLRSHGSSQTKAVGRRARSLRTGLYAFVRTHVSRRKPNHRPTRCSSSSG